MTTFLASLILLSSREGKAIEKVRADEILSWPVPVNVSGDFREWGGEIHGLLPPVAICPGILERAEWSPDGARVILIRRLPPPVGDRAKPALEPQAELLVHDLKTNRSTSYWTFDAAQVKIEQVEWLPGSDTVVINTTWPAERDPASSLVMLNPRKPRIYLLDPSRKVSATLVDGKYADRVRVLVSPSKPLGVVTLVPAEGDSRVALFGMNGLLGEVKAPGRGFGMLSFDQTGRHVLVSRSAGGRIQSTRIDFEKGELVSAPGLVPFMRRPSPSSVVLEWRPLPPDIAKTDPRGILYCRLGKDQASPIVVSSDSDTGVVRPGRGTGKVPSVAPDGSAILYRSQGIGLVRRLVKLTRSQHLEMLAQWYRYRAMRDCAEAFAVLEDSHANSRGTETLSLMEWLSANPAWSSKTRERLGDPSIAARFTFAPNLRSLPGRSPETAPIGFSATPAGTARLFGNGLVEWVPDPDFLRPPSSTLAD